MRPKHTCPNRVSVQGNNGGSYVELSDERDLPNGMAYLEVGETCVRTVAQPISVVALAMILTWAKDYGFQKIVDNYCQNEGYENISVDGRPLVARGEGDE